MSKPNAKGRTLTKEETEDYLAAFNAFKGDDNSLDSREFICILVALGVEGGEERAQVRLHVLALVTLLLCKTCLLYSLWWRRNGGGGLCRM